MAAYLRVYEIPFLIECVGMTVPELADAVREWGAGARPIVFSEGNGFTFVVNFHLLPCVIVTDSTALTKDEDGIPAPIVRVQIPSPEIVAPRSAPEEPHLV
ncbi:hypothetical protein [Umezawaea sp. Da 62-37]|uniref:hypothetical protein n=1 Tax=Umezawaea sp. Da 62-37 TaxID=3075927 RepID=UPI0028F6F23E|nr:hypothetical protein [Umezawaea sp. Da 62-37]WNV83945.1 hypothetical protein RM788_38145 [Umezawaea sp. Da 62-37]